MHDVPLFKATTRTKFDYIGWHPVITTAGILMFGDVEFDLAAGTVQVGIRCWVPCWWPPWPCLHLLVCANEYR